MTPTPHHEVSGAIAALVQGRHQQPHDLLGQHLEEGGLRIRVLRPMAGSVRVRFEDGEELALGHEAEGVFSAVRPDADRTMDYRVLTTWGDGIEHESDDPTASRPLWVRSTCTWSTRGATSSSGPCWAPGSRPTRGPMGEVTGTSFAVWAPRAKAVRVIGDFNGWDGRVHPMRMLGNSGVWELFVPGVGAGSVYKYEIRGADDVIRAKADPMARRTEVPRTRARSSTTRSTSGPTTTGWPSGRETNPHTGPMSVYEVHLGSWRQGSSYRDLAEHLVNYVKDLGFTHVEFLPVMEHPTAPHGATR